MSAALELGDSVGKSVACRALSRSREAMALTVVNCPRCIAEMTCSSPILAVLRMPQRSLVCMGLMIDERAAR
jgi:hypothetical protein